MDLRDGNGQMKRPMTTAEYFNVVCKILKEKGFMPQNFLDYSLATSNPVPMKTYQFILRNNLDYGGSEEIYLDLWVEFYEDGEKQIHDIGTFKTLQDGQEAMRTMATRPDNPLKKMQSLIVIACKILRVIFTILRTGRRYDPEKMLKDIRRPVKEQVSAA